MPASRKLIDEVHIHSFRAKAALVALDETTPEPVRRYAERVAKKEIVLAQTSNSGNVLEVFKVMTEWQQYFAGMTWGLCEAPQGSSFVTSDNPVHTVDEGTIGRSFDEYDGPTIGLRFTYPLSPKFTLTGQYVPARDQVMTVDGPWVAQANQAQVYRALTEVYAAFRSGELREQVDRIHRIRRPVIPVFPAPLRT